jgi:hypothetical protein
MTGFTKLCIPALQGEQDSLSRVFLQEITLCESQQLIPRDDGAGDFRVFLALRLAACWPSETRRNHPTGTGVVPNYKREIWLSVRGIFGASSVSGFMSSSDQSRSGIITMVQPLGEWSSFSLWMGLG